MPTYEYRCKDCSQHLEVVQAFTDDALTECPGCGGNLKKVFGSIGITFKGSGFYKTDSRGKSSSTSSTSESSGSASNGSSAGSDSSSTGSSKSGSSGSSESGSSSTTSDSGSTAKSA